MLVTCSLARLLIPRHHGISTPILQNQVKHQTTHIENWGEHAGFDPKIWQYCTIHDTLKLTE